MTSPHARSRARRPIADGYEGAITLAAIATALNDRKIPTPRGVRWHVSSAMNLLARAQKLEALRYPSFIDGRLSTRADVRIPVTSDRVSGRLETHGIAPEKV